MTAPKAGHTPGPLVVERHDIDDGSIAFEIWTADSMHRTARITDDDNPNALCDAKLYAAAPDTAAERDRLRDLIMELLAHAEQYEAFTFPGVLAESGWFKRAHAAIARAEGGA
jgi:hypothetical protein